MPTMKLGCNCPMTQARSPAFIRSFYLLINVCLTPAPSPDITTVPTGQFALAGLSPVRPSTSFTALSRRTPDCPSTAENHGDWRDAVDQFQRRTPNFLMGNHRMSPPSAFEISQAYPGTPDIKVRLSATPG